MDLKTIILLKKKLKIGNILGVVVVVIENIGHDILQNCYISPKDSNGFILTLGSCCIKRFLEKPYATCEICELKHRNTKDNICKDCRMKCIKCNIIRTNKHDSGLCKNCLRKCNGCRKMIYKKLDKCIGCKYNS